MTNNKSGRKNIKKKEQLLTVGNGRTNTGEDEKQGGDKFSKIGLNRPTIERLVKTS